jgi:hypothetical protein
MKNIHQKQTIFQHFLESAIYIFLLCFDLLPEVQPKQTICFDSPYERKVKDLTRAVRAFNLKKSGGRGV